MSINRGMDRKDVVHKGYYSACGKKGMMSFAASWMDLESVILSDLSQTEKEKLRMTSLVCGI